MLHTPNLIRTAWFLRIAAPANMATCFFLSCLNYRAGFIFLFALMILCGLVSAGLTWVEWYVFIIPTKRRL